MKKTYKTVIADESLILELLVNKLYSRKIQTPIQEVICNARDAMREAGNNGPIEISFPSGLSSELVIRDYGAGLTEEEFIKHFVPFAGSSKIFSKKATGQNGLGSKSPFAFTDLFTVTSYKNGKKMPYMARRTENRGGEFTPMFDTPIETDEKDGLEIKIPINLSQQGEALAGVMFTTLLFETPPIFKGEIPSSYENFSYNFHKKSIKTKNCIVYHDYRVSGKYGNICLSVDGVLYPKTNNEDISKAIEAYLPKLNSSAGCILKFENKELFLNPNRELIEDIAENTEIIVKRIEEAGQELNVVWRELNSLSEDIDELIRRRTQLSLFKGETIDFSLMMEEGHVRCQGRTVSYIFKDKTLFCTWNGTKTNSHTLELNSSNLSFVEMKKIPKTYVQQLFNHGISQVLVDNKNKTLSRLIHKYYSKCENIPEYVKPERPPVRREKKNISCRIVVAKADYGDNASTSGFIDEDFQVFKKDKYFGTSIIKNNGREFYYLFKDEVDRTRGWKREYSTIDPFELGVGHYFLVVSKKDAPKLPRNFKHIDVLYQEKVNELKSNLLLNYCYKQLRLSYAISEYVGRALSRKEEVEDPLMRKIIDIVAVVKTPISFGKHEVMDVCRLTRDELYNKECEVMALFAKLAEKAVKKYPIFFELYKIENGLIYLREKYELERLRKEKSTKTNP